MLYLVGDLLELYRGFRWVGYIEGVRRETLHGHGIDKHGPNCIPADDTVLSTVRSPSLKETPCSMKQG